jgi:peptidoglycan/LPS O-acetylase OafA/YrhL
VPEIDGLRGVAACGVAFFSHINMLTGAKGGPLAGVPGFNWLYSHGTSLVDLFFVLSGFVMCHVYADRQDSRMRAGVTWRDYIVARLARLYPLHLLTLLLAAALLAVPAVQATRSHLPYDAYHFGLNLVFLQRSGLEEYHSFNISAWSLTAEMAAYLAFFAVVGALKRRIPEASMIVILIAILALLSGFLNLYVTRGLVGFFSGALLWWTWPSLKRIHGAWLTIALVVTFWITFGLVGNGPASYLLASVLVWPLLMALSCRGSLSTMLSSPPTQWLGRLSFSIYLLHLPVYYLRPVILGEPPLPPEHWAAANIVAVVAVLGLSHLSYLYFEVPTRDQLRRLGAERPRLAIA